MLEVRLRPGWVMVSAESGRLLDEPDQLAVDLASVRHEGNGVYTITTGTDETFRLIKRVGPVDPGVNLAYTVHLGDMPGYDGDFDGVPTVDLTLSDRMVNDEVAPMLARALAESTAVLRGGRATDGDRVFGPGGTPDVDAVQRPVDAGHRAELRQRGLLERRLGRTDFVRRTAVRKEIRKLALTMGVADGQPNAKLLRTLLTEDERAILDRAKDGGRPLEERVDQRGYLAKALGGSGVSSVVIGQPRPTACRHWGPRLSRSPTPARSCTSRSTATSQSPTATARAKPSQTSARSTPPTADASSAA